MPTSRLPITAAFSQTLLLLLSLSLAGCYSIQWSAANLGEETSSITSSTKENAPPAILKVFKNHPKGVITMPVLTPGLSYDYDISEKDPYFANQGKKLAFQKVTFQLAPKMPMGQVLVDILFWDSTGNYLELGKVDLLRITPMLETEGAMQHAEYLLEEFSRFGVTFRKEFDEFQLVTKTGEPELIKAADRAYRVDLTNNCLDRSKWEIQLISEDYSDAPIRKKSKLNYNQDRMLSHGWFYLDGELSMALLQLKNPNTITPDLYTMPYDSLSKIGESVVVDFEKLRQPIRKTTTPKILELGFKTERPIIPIDTETGFKRSMGLLGGDTLHTYKSVLEKPINLAKFDKEGFYDPADPRVYDYSYLSGIDEVQVAIVDVPGSDCHVELRLTGTNAWYMFTIGNIDLATIEEQRMYGINVGVNLYPKSRRYNPQQSTVVFDSDLTPADRLPYFLMTETKTGKWVNNQFKGVEKAYIGYNSLLGNTLDIYLISYERELPVWYAQIKLDGAMREKIRARRSMYSY